MSLYYAAKNTRRAINLLTVLFIFVLVGKLSWNLGFTFYYRLFPPTSAPPPAAYGKLPVLKINSLRLKSTAVPVYRLDTAIGKFPLFPDRAPVYKLKEVQAALLAEKNALSFASNLGFTGQRYEESAIDWSWKDTVNSRTLKLNILTSDFNLESDPVLIAPTAPRGTAPSLTEAESIASGFLKTNKLIDEDVLKSAVFTGRYVQISGSTLKVVEQQREAQMVEVNFFSSIPVVVSDYSGVNSRILPKTWEVVSSNPDRGTTQLFISASSNASYQIPFVNHSAQRLDLTKKSVYPLITIETAWDVLTNNKASITLLRIKGDNPLGAYTPLSIGQVDIREIKLAYLDTNQPYRTFLEPIYVFEGEAFIKEEALTDTVRARFVAYVPAVDPRCLGETDLISKPCDAIPR